MLIPSPTYGTAKGKPQTWGQQRSRADKKRVDWENVYCDSGPSMLNRKWCAGVPLCTQTTMTSKMSQKTRSRDSNRHVNKYTHRLNEKKHQKKPLHSQTKSNKARKGIGCLMRRQRQNKSLIYTPKWDLQQSQFTTPWSPELRKPRQIFFSSFSY